MASDLRFIRILLVLFMAALVLSGLTAVPLVPLAGLLEEWTTPVGGTLHAWAQENSEALKHVQASYPTLFYGTDWLAFAHIAIALAFIGPWRDPIRNRWVVEWGVWCCVLVLPVAFIWAPVRGIPFFWRCVDASFGLLGAVPLLMIQQRVKRLAAGKESLTAC